jgi:purine nucleoside phosphorylase
MLGIVGADLVGMSAVLEAIAAGGRPVLGISLVTNPLRVSAGTPRSCRGSGRRWRAEADGASAPSVIERREPVRAKP